MPWEGAVSGTLQGMRQVREALAGPERDLWREIEAFERTRPSTSSNVIKAASAPLQAMIPERVTEAMRSALSSLVDLVQRTNEWDIRPEQILRESPFASIEEVQAKASVADLRALCESHSTPAILKATLQGAGLGLGGVMLAVADVPLLMLSHLKLLSRLAICCGIDLTHSDEHRFLLALLKLSYCLGDWDGRVESIRELEDLITAEFRHQETESEDIARTVLFRSAGAFADKVGPILLRKRFGAAMPLIGSLFGAGSNYLLTKDVVAAGRNTLMKRFLVERVRRG